MPIVAYRKLTVYYKIEAPNQEALEQFEESLLWRGISIVRALTNLTRMAKYRVKVLPRTGLDWANTHLITIEGAAPFIMSYSTEKEPADERGR